MDSPGDYVKVERERRGLSVREAASRTGPDPQDKISNTYWGDFERGKRALSPQIERAVAKVFGWEANWATRRDELVELRNQLETHVADYDFMMNVTVARIEALERDVANLLVLTKTEHEQFALAAEGAGKRPPKKRIEPPALSRPQG